MNSSQNLPAQELRRSKRLSAYGVISLGTQINGSDPSLSQLTGPARSNVTKSRGPTNKRKNTDEDAVNKRQKRLSGFFVRLEDADDTNATENTNTTSVNIKTETADVTVTVKKKRAIIRRPEGGWDNKEASWKWNWSPYPQHVGPSSASAAQVFDVLRTDLAKRKIIVGPGEKGDGWVRPEHGSGHGLTVDAVVRTMLSQATSNKNATFVQKLLRQKFRYNVDGKRVKGAVPNYHEVRLTSHKILEEIIQPGGLYQKRAVFIKTFLDTVYRINTVHNPEWDGVVRGNPIDTPNFVPGPLSLGFLAEKSKEEIFDWLLTIDGVGIKTAQCVLEFNCGFAVCAVDTHIHFMAAALGWIPEECGDANKAAMHLDARLPDELKHDIHQAFWHHRQECGPCKRFDGIKSKEKDTKKCCLEKLLSRRRTRKSPVKPKMEMTPQERMEMIAARQAERAQNPVRKPSKMEFKKFKSEEAAAEAGYELDDQDVDDDFAAGSVNKGKLQIWVLRREAEME